MPKVPRHIHPINCFKEGMLEFDGPLGGQFFSRVLTVSKRSWGEWKRGKEGTALFSPFPHVSVFIFYC